MRMETQKRSEKATRPLFNHFIRGYLTIFLMVGQSESRSERRHIVLAKENRPLAEGKFSYHRGSDCKISKEFRKDVVWMSGEEMEGSRSIRVAQTERIFSSDPCLNMVGDKFFGLPPQVFSAMAAEDCHENGLSLTPGGTHETMSRLVRISSFSSNDLVIPP